LFAQTVRTDEIENDLPLEKFSKITKLLESIPEYSRNLYIGPLRIYPSLEISETFTDNVFGVSHNNRGTQEKIRDFYTTYKPRISLSLPFMRHTAAFDYGYEIFEYERLDEQERVNRKFGGVINLNFFKGFSISLSDRVSITRAPRRITRRTNPIVQFPTGEEAEEGEETEVEEEIEVLEAFGFNTPTPGREITNNVASLSINLPDFFDKLDFEIHYSNTDVSYKGRRFNGSERNTDVIGGTIIIKPLPRINITTGFDYTIIKYDSSFANDSTFQTIPFNISWQPTVKSNFFLNTRYNIRDYGRRSIFENFEGLDATLGYRFNVTERDNLTIKFERSLREQQFQRDPVNTAVGDDNPNFFTQFNIDYIHQFPRRNFSFKFSPTFQTLRFREGAAITQPREKVDTIRLEASVRYNAPRNWLFCEISYNYQDRNSTLSNGGLVTNIAQISVGLSF
jgi:hypothetical protein